MCVSLRQGEGEARLALCAPCAACVARVALHCLPYATVAPAGGGDGGSVMKGGGDGSTFRGGGVGGGVGTPLSLEALLKPITARHARTSPLLDGYFPRG